MNNKKVFETAIKRNENQIAKIEGIIAKYQMKIDALQLENKELRELMEKHN